MSLKEKLKKRSEHFLNRISEVFGIAKHYIQKKKDSCLQPLMIFSKLKESLDKFIAAEKTTERVFFFTAWALLTPFFIATGIIVPIFFHWELYFGVVTLPIIVVAIITFEVLNFVAGALFDVFNILLPDFMSVTSKNVTSKNVSSNMPSEFFSDPNRLEKNITLIAKENNKRMLVQEYDQFMKQKQHHQQAFKLMLTNAEPFFKNREGMISEAESSRIAFKAGIEAGNKSAMAHRENKLPVAELLPTINAPSVAATPVVKNKRGMFSFSFFDCSSKPKTASQPLPQSTSSNPVRSRVRKLFGY